MMYDFSEIVHYDSPGIPLFIREIDLSSYANSHVLCHWHEDIECIRALTGHMYYSVNGKQIYIEPVIKNSTIEFYHLHPDSPKESAILSYMNKIHDLKRAGSPGYELDIVGQFHSLWANFFHLLSAQSLILPHTDHVDHEMSIQKKMVSFIYENYAGKLTLDEIAASGGVCRSKCCQIFKKYLNNSPIGFLNLYRLEVSQYQLIHTDIPVTEIALSCGFNHLSYFSEIFRKYSGCTPQQYRAEHRTNPESERKMKNDEIFENNR